MAERDPVEEVKEAMLPSEEWCECEDEVMLERSRWDEDEGGGRCVVLLGGMLVS